MIEMFIIFKHLLKFRVMKKLGLFLLYAGISYTACSQETLHSLPAEFREVAVRAFQNAYLAL
jgi:hypothetical protein